MPIPEQILSVARPKNSVVICYGKNMDHYAVRERIGCKYVNGRRVPVNGPTIGHMRTASSRRFIRTWRFRTTPWASS